LEKDTYKSDLPSSLPPALPSTPPSLVPSFLGRALCCHDSHHYCTLVKYMLTQKQQLSFC